MTICEAIKRIKKQDLSREQLELLAIIEIKAAHMEDRLLEYCNAIEDLGFERVGRDDDKQ